MNHGIEEICDRIRARFDAMDKAREQSLALSRKITRYSGDAIKAIHRGEWDQSEKLIAAIRLSSTALVLTAASR